LPYRVINRADIWSATQNPTFQNPIAPPPTPGKIKALYQVVEKAAMKRSTEKNIKKTFSWWSY
jgi:hypothetical protein